MPNNETERGPSAEVVPLRPADAVPEADRPRVIRADVTEHRWNSAPERRPVLPPWLRHADQRRQAAKWAARHTGHIAAFHAVRTPLYLSQHAVRSPRGLGRITVAAWRWTFDREAHDLRVGMVEARDAAGYARLAKIRHDRVRMRLAVLGAAAVVFAIAAGAAIDLWPAARWLMLGLAVLTLGWLGRPAGRPVIPHATVSARAERLTPDVIVRALGSLSLAGIDRVLREGREINFVTPPTRDGPGWRVAVDLPYGVTAADVIDRRERLASGLRRPLGCVWPEPVSDEHTGRLVLHVTDVPLSKARQAAWPLLKAGKADLFAPIPFAVDQRGRPVALTLMFANLLVGSIPRMGKTVSLLIVLLAAALDPRAELRIWELKGTGDLDPLAPVAHRFGSGADDETLAAALADLADIADHELIRRAAVIRGLPSDLAKARKVTPELAARKSLRLHPLVIAVDEAQELFSHKQYGPLAAKYAEMIIKRGPALGIMLLLGTQRPDAKSLPTGVTANVALRFCLKVMDQVANDMVLGTSSYKRGVNAALLAFSDKGIGWLIGAGDDAQVVRTYYIDAPAAERVVTRARQLRETAGTITGHAAGDASAEPVKVSLLDDVAAVIGPDEAAVWSESLCPRLAELRPALYGWLTPTALAQALGGYGVTTGQVWGRDADGKGVNRRGVSRADLDAARAASSRAARSSTATSDAEPVVTSPAGADDTDLAGEL